MNNLARAIDTTPLTATFPCRVIDVSPLSINTFQVELQSPAGTVLAYQAGQYLQLELDVNGDGRSQWLSYSIANRCHPEYPRRLQLIIQNSSEFTVKMFNRLRERKATHAKVNVNLPRGKAFLQTDLGLPHVLVAAGSGIAKIKCITEEILHQRPDANVNIYWSNKTIEDFYLLDTFQGWAHKYRNLHFIPVLESAESDWTGRSGYLYQVIEQDFGDLDGAQVYLCGSPQMVYGTIDQLKTHGLQEQNCYSDVFEYAPRNTFND